MLVQSSSSSAKAASDMDMMAQTEAEIWIDLGLTRMSPFRSDGFFAGFTATHLATRDTVLCHVTLSNLTPTHQTMSAGTTKRLARQCLPIAAALPISRCRLQFSNSHARRVERDHFELPIGVIKQAEMELSSPQLPWTIQGIDRFGCLNGTTFGQLWRVRMGWRL